MRKARSTNDTRVKPKYMINEIKLSESKPGKTLMDPYKFAQFLEMRRFKMYRSGELEVPGETFKPFPGKMKGQNLVQ